MMYDHVGDDNYFVGCKISQDYSWNNLLIGQQM